MRSENVTQSNGAVVQKSSIRKLPNTFLGTTWQSNCEMQMKRKKLAIPLHPPLRMIPLTGNNKPHTNMTITLKVLKEILYGKAKTGTTKRKNHQTLTRNNGTTGSDKEQGKCFYFLSSLVNYLQMLCHGFKAGHVAAHFAAWRTLTNDKIFLSDV